MRNLVAVALCLLLAGAVAAPAAFDQRLAAALARAEARMARNISPTFTKSVEGRTIVPASGSVIASPSPRDPDYFFHWIRDSALVMDAVATLYERASRPEDVARYEGMLDAYVAFSRRLQDTPVKTGLGETRFNADGSPDTVLYSRPQFDGPALRALTFMHYLAVRKTPLAPATLVAVRRGLELDLDFIDAHWNEPCDDVWESYKGLYYYTRLVQLGAAERAAPVFERWGDAARAARYRALAARLLPDLDRFWRADAGFMTYSLGPLTDIAGKPAPRPGDGLDTGVLMAAVHSRRASGPHSIFDDRLLQTAVKLEDQFAELYPINRVHRHGPGVAMGRHRGDGYYGGHPFFFLTSAYAELHYRMAALVKSGTTVRITARSAPFFAKASARAGLPAWPAGAVPTADPASRAALVAALRQRGDDIVEAMLAYIPADGEMAEQFDKETGAPQSGRDLTWSYASLITAGLARP